MKVITKLLLFGLFSLLAITCEQPAMAAPHTPPTMVVPDLETLAHRLRLLGIEHTMDLALDEQSLHAIAQEILMKDQRSADGLLYRIQNLIALRIGHYLHNETKELLLASQEITSKPIEENNRSVLRLQYKIEESLAVFERLPRQLSLNPSYDLGELVDLLQTTLQKTQDFSSSTEALITKLNLFRGTPVLTHTSHERAVTNIQAVLFPNKGLEPAYQDTVLDILEMETGTTTLRAISRELICFVAFTLPEAPGFFEYTSNSLTSRTKYIAAGTIATGTVFGEFLTMVLGQVHGTGAVLAGLSVVAGHGTIKYRHWRQTNERWMFNLLREQFNQYVAIPLGFSPADSHEQFKRAHTLICEVALTNAPALR